MSTRIIVRHYPLHHNALGMHLGAALRKISACTGADRGLEQTYNAIDMECTSGHCAHWSTAPQGIAMAASATTRQLIVNAWKAIKSEGGTPTLELVQTRIPPEAQSILGSTVRLLNLIERSGARTVAGIKKWQSQLPKDSDPDLLRGFSTESAHETVDCYFVKDVEMEPQRENIKGENLGSQSNDGDGEGGQGSRGGSTGLARLDAFEMAGRFQEAIAAEREKAAVAARADERRVAEAELAALRQISEAKMAAEQARGSARASASRLYAIVGVIVALVAGAVGGVAWSKSKPQSVAPATQVQQGVQPQHQVAPTDTPKPEPKTEPMTEQPKEGGESAVPKTSASPEKTTVIPEKNEVKP